MFEEFFNLRENPFTLAPNPRFIFRSHEHNEALAHLLYWIENGEGFVLITGEVGTGKTTALFDLMSQLSAEWAVAFVANSTLTESELLEEICRRFQVEIPAISSKPALLQKLEHHLTERSGRGLGALLILDEAQNFESRLLEEIRLLSNLEQADGKLLQIALVGQPELERKLEQPELRQLRQRIGVRYRLNPLSEEETVHYVHHRLAVAGGNAEAILPPESGIEIHRLTHGIPREINIVASQALISAFVEGASVVRPEHVRNVVLDFAWSSIMGRGPLLPAPRRELRPRVPFVEATPPTRTEAAPAPPREAAVPSRRAEPVPPPPRGEPIPSRGEPIPSRGESAPPRGESALPRAGAAPPLEVVRGRGTPPKVERVAEAFSAGRGPSAMGEADPEDALAMQSMLAAREPRAWIDSLTESEDKGRSWRSIVLWVVVVLALAAGGAFLWSQRSELGLAPNRKSEPPRTRGEVETVPEPSVPLPAGEGTSAPEKPAEQSSPGASAPIQASPIEAASKKPAVTQPASTTRVSTQPAGSKPATSKPTTSKPTAGQPVTQPSTQPAVSQPAENAPAESAPSSSPPANPPPAIPDAPVERPLPGPYAALN